MAGNRGALWEGYVVGDPRTIPILVAKCFPEVSTPSSKAWGLRSWRRGAKSLELGHTERVEVEVTTSFDMRVVA